VIKTSWSKISLTFFLIIALLGSIIRLAPFSDVVINYKHIIHSHSHVAFQGWIYTALFLLICKLYLDDNILKKNRYSLQFKLSILTIIGIMVSFLFQGYALFSILFSSIFQMLNYWFAFRFFKDVGVSEKSKEHSFSLKFIKIGLWMMILSTIGPWVVGVLSAKGLKGSEYYDAALYFFLHFQYNGWFTFAVVGIFFWLLEHYQITFKLKEANLFFILFSFAVIPAYTLSLLGMSFRSYLITFGYISAILQLISLFYLLKSIYGTIQTFKEKVNSWSFLLYRIVASVFFLKIILQFASVLPFLQSLAFRNHNLIIAYIHLVMIGFISFSLLGNLLQLRWLTINSILNKLGVVFLIGGFILSELILIALDFEVFLFNKFLLLLIFSLLMLLGIFLILIGQFRKNESN